MLKSLVLRKNKLPLIVDRMFCRSLSWIWADAPLAPAAAPAPGAADVVVPVLGVGVWDGNAAAVTGLGCDGVVSADVALVPAEDCVLSGLENKDFYMSIKIS